MHATFTPKAQIFSYFALWWAIFDLRPFFLKSATNDPKRPWHVQGQKYQYACYIHIWDPNFHPLCSTMSHFWVMAQFWKECTVWPQNGLDKFKIKSTCICLQNTPQRPILCAFRSTMSCFQVMPLSLSLFFFFWGGGSAPNDPKWLWHFHGKSTNMHATPPPPPTRPKFLPISLYDKPFSTYAPLFRKSAPNDPK